MQLIDGKIIAAQIKAEIAAKVAQMIDAGQKAPHLAAILVGEDPASQTYVANKEKSAHEVGITSSVYKYPDNTSEQQLLEIIHFLNNDDEVDGFIVQLPLPAQLNADKIIQAIDYRKDVDGFHPVNLGRMMLGLPSFLPATPMGILEMIKRTNIETEGKHVVVLGRSNIVGTPVSLMLSRKTIPGNATVTICHSKTQNLEDIAASADILIAAIGVPHFVKEHMVKEGAVVIDVGMHRIEDPTKKSGFRLTGDVDFEKVAPKTSFITPVPGGVGLTTVTSLLMNTLKAAQHEIYPI